MARAANPAAFYARVSTDQQDGSLEMQASKAIEYARLKRLDIPEDLRFTDEDTSGGLPLLERDGGRLLVNTFRLHPQVKNLIVTKLDRLGRSVLDLETTFQRFKQQGIIVHIVDFGGDSFTTAGFLGDLVIRILSAVAEFERMMIKSRIKDRLDHKRTKGELCGTVPYGWDKAPTGRLNAKGKEIFHLRANSVEQEWVRKMATWRGLGWSYKAIADELNRLGVPTKSGKSKWQSGNVAGVLDSQYSRALLCAEPQHQELES